MPPAAHRFRAVVFDLDGVIADSEHLWEEYWSAYAADHGTRWESRHTSAVQGMSAPEWAAYLTDLVGADHPGTVTETAVVDNMISAIAAGRAPLLDGAAEMVGEVSKRAPIALASSAPRRVIHAVLATHGLTAHFTATVSSAEVARGKPHPDVYLEAASRLGVPAGECLAVEDSSNGILAAANAGMRVVARPNPVYPPRAEALARAYAAWPHLHEVRATLLAELDPAATGQAVPDGGGA